MPSAFLTTKLTVPNPGEKLVDRSRLLQKLDQSLAPDKRLTILSAPAGYGKTVLVSSWIRQQAERRPALGAAWLSLDAGDNDPVRFWSYVAAAFQRQESQIGREALALLGSPADFPQELFLIILLNSLAESASDWVLVLDDYHLIVESAIHRALAYVLERLPGGCHFLILARSDPPLPTALLRGRNQLLEMRQDDLCFRDEEAAALLVDCLGLRLSAAEIQLLNAKAEGWASGLQLAAVSLQGQTDRGQFIRSFTGTNRYILDYLVGEVLECQEPGVREFLLRTSILETLSAPLCQTLCEAPPQPAGAAACPDAQSVLEYLRRANLFVISLDEEHLSFRYHHLFADLLRRQLALAHPESVRPLHARASTWLEQHGMLEQAIQHALLAKDYERGAGLLSQGADALWNRGEHATLLRLIHALPDTYRPADPRLAIYEAASCVSTGHLDEAERRLADAEGQMAATHRDRSEANLLKGRAAAVRVLIAAYRGNAEAALAFARASRELLPRGETVWNNRFAVAAGNVLLMAGRYNEGREEMARAMQAGRDSNSALVYLYPATMLCLLAWTQGHADEAQRIVREARAYLRANDLEGMPAASGISVVQGILLMEQGLLDDAEALTDQGLKMATSVEDFAMVALAFLGLVICRLSHRDWQGAVETLDRADLALKDHDYPFWTRCTLAGIRATVLVRQGRLQEAERYLYARQVTPDGQVAYPHQNEYLSLASLLIQRRRWEAAWRVLDRLEQYCVASDMQVWLIPVYPLRAHIYLAQGQSAEVEDALRSAWALAGSLGRYQDFQYLDDKLLPLFLQIASPREVPEAVWRLITQAPGALPSPIVARSVRTDRAPVERLSERELEVLRLIAAGLPNREIGRRLHVEVQTVKFHAGNIYGKLGVQNRLQAVARAQELGILSPGTLS